MFSISQGRFFACRFLYKIGSILSVFALGRGVFVSARGNSWPQSSPNVVSIGDDGDDDDGDDDNNQ